MSGLLAFLALSSVAFAAGPAPVNLGTAGNYAILAKTGVSTVPQSSITGDLGASPVAKTYYTGFSTTDSETGTYATSQQVNGRLYAANDASPTPSVLTTAVSDMQTAFTDAASRSNPDYLNLGGGTVSGYTFAPGLYNWGSDVQITADCYVNGTANDTWIFQISGELTVASATKLILSGGAAPGNIVWVVSQSVTLGSTSEFNGIMLGQTALHMNTGASINGRLLAQSAVTLQSATVQSTGLNATYFQNGTDSVTSQQKRSTRYSTLLN
ncbi:hypothetical protein P7C70_g8054, partial [Phenoliferia sp. Uapishka_3]